MDHFAQGSVEVFTPPAARRSDAIAAVFGGSLARAARYIDQSPRKDGELLFAVADSWGGFSNAALLTRSPGRTAMLAVTAPRCTSDDESGVALVRRAIAAAHQLDARLVQSLVDPEHDRTLQMLLRGGMRSIGILAYLEKSPGHRPVPLRPLPAGVTIRAWDPQERLMLEGLLEETYVDSLDCPGLARMRTTQEILDGHLNSGIVHPGWWNVLELDGRPCGVSLASEIPSVQCMELVYFGLAPSARGRALGGHLLDFTCSNVGRLGELSLALACDEKNVPALRLYESRGFLPRLRRTALVALAST